MTMVLSLSASVALFQFAFTFRPLKREFRVCTPNSKLSFTAISPPAPATDGDLRPAVRLALLDRWLRVFVPPRAKPRETRRCHAGHHCRQKDQLLPAFSAGP